MNEYSMTKKDLLLAHFKPGGVPVFGGCEELVKEGLLEKYNAVAHYPNSFMWSHRLTAKGYSSVYMLKGLTNGAPWRLPDWVLSEITKSGSQNDG